MDKIAEDAYKGLLKIFETKGRAKFMKVYNQVKVVLSEDERSLLLAEVDTSEKYQQPKKISKENGGDGGGFGGAVATSTDSGFFTPTYGGGNKKKKKVEKKYETLKKALDQRHMENDTPKVSEFPSEMDNTAAEAEQEYVMQVEQIKDGEQKDRRSRESAVSDSVDPSAEIVSLMKDLDNLMEEAYHGRTTNIQKIMHLLEDDNS